MEIGTLTGSITLEDQMSSGLTLVSQRVEKFADSFDGALKGIAIGVGIGVAAVGAMTAAITTLATRGSDVDDVQNAFEQFSGGVEIANESLAKMNEGALGTIDRMTLMKTGAKLLSSGVNLTSENFGQLTSAAIALQNQGFGPTTEMLDKLSRSLLTGQARGLKQVGILIDQGKAEADYAKQIGTTVDKLTDAGKVEATRAAMLVALAEKVKSAGVAHRDFGEQIEFAIAKVTNFVDKLAQQVSSSPAVTQAVNAIGSALKEAFGGSSDAVIKRVVGGIELFARVVTSTTSYIVPFVKGIVDLKNAMYDYRIVVEAIVGALVLYNSTSILSSIALSGFMGPVRVAITNITLYGLAEGTALSATYLWNIATVAMKGVMIALTGAVKAAYAVMLAHPFIVIAAAIAGITIAYVQWRTSQADSALAAEVLGAKQDVINKALRDGALVGIEYAEALTYNNETYRKAHGGAMLLDDALKGLSADAFGATERIRELQKTTLALAAQGKLTGVEVSAIASAIKMSGIAAKDLTPQLLFIAKSQGVYTDALDKSRFISSKASDAQKEYAEALKNYSTVTGDYQTVLASLGNMMYEGIAYDLRRAVSTSDLAKIYKVSEGVIKSVADAEKDWAEDSKKFMESAWEATIKWAETWEDSAARVSAAFIKNRDIMNAADVVANDTVARRSLNSYNYQRYQLNQLVLSQKKSVDSMGENAAEAYRKIDASAAQAFIDITLAEQKAGQVFGDDFVGPILQEAPSLKESLTKNVTAVLQSIPDLLKQAFTGGGGLLGAAKALGVSITDAIVSPMMKALGETKSAILGSGSALAGALGGAAGGSSIAMVGSLASGLASVGIAAKIGTAGMTSMGTAGMVAISAATLGIGAAVAGVGMLIKKWWSHRKEVQENQKAVAAFEKQVWSTLTASQAVEAAGRTWAATTISVRDAYLDTGRSVVQAEADVKALWNSSELGAAAVQAAVDKINVVFAEQKQRLETLNSGLSEMLGLATPLGVRLPAAIYESIKKLVDMKGVTQENIDLFKALSGSTEVDFKAMQSIAEKYGIDLANLGPAFQSARLHDAAATIINDFDILTRNGADVDSVLFGMSGKISALVIDSLKFGTDIPANMKPWIERLDAAGKLVDDNGDKISGLGELKFADPIVTEFQKIVNKIQELIDKIATTLPAAIVNVPGMTIPVEMRRRWTDENNPSQDTSTLGFAAGGIVPSYYGQGSNVLSFTPKGTDTVPAMLTPGERVLSVAQNKVYEGKQDKVSNRDVVDAVNGLRHDLTGKMPRALARAMDAALVGLRTAS